MSSMPTILLALLNKILPAGINRASIVINGLRYYSLLFYFLLAYITGYAQTGMIDRSFNQGDYTPYIPYSTNTLLSLPDGKILAGTGDYSPYINRYDKYGMLDTTFKRGEGFDWQISKLALLSDGKILVGGRFTKYDNQPCGNLVRLNQDGSLDNSFQPWQGAKPNNLINSITIQNNGKILIGKGACRADDTAIYRLNADGSLDNSFFPGKAFVANAFADISSILLQPDGKIVIGGTFSIYNGIATNHILRLNANGTIDNSFNVGSGFNLVNGAIKCLALQADGMVLAGGRFTSYNSDTQSYFLRLKPDGTIDSSFNPVLDSWVNAVVVQPDGKIIAGGVFTTGIARFNTDGNLDTNYKTGTAFYVFINGFGGRDVYTLALQPDNSVLVGGEFSKYNGSTRINILRIKPDGILDSSFRIGGASEQQIHSIAFQKDSMILAGGTFRSYDGDNYSGIVLLFLDGRPDSTFKPAFDNYVNKIAVQPDGKILVGGGFTRCNSTYSPFLIRLNINGTPDTTFHIGTGFMRTPYVTGYGVRAIAIQPDGKIIVGGMFTSFNGNNRNNIVRLNKDGTLDNSFDIGTGIDTINNAFIFVNAITIQPDGKILVGGQFFSYNGIARNGIVRLYPDGSVDNEINVGTDERAYSYMLLPDGKILLSKWSDALQTGRLVRVQPNGLEDSSYNTQITDAAITVHALQPDGKILYSAYSKTGRLLKDGNTDPSFYAGEAGSGYPTGGGRPYHGPVVNTIALQPDGKIMVGGNFYTYNGVVRNHLARLFNTYDVDTNNVVQHLRIYPNPNNGIIHIKFGDSPSGNYKIDIIDMWGRYLLRTNKTVSGNFDEISIDIRQFASAPYILRLHHPELHIVKKLIKL